MTPTHISIADYSYDLPQENIAFYPLATRDASRLLIYRDGAIAEDTYQHIGKHLPEQSLLIFNNTKVVEARIVFQKETGARIEIFCLEPPVIYGGIVTAMAQKGIVKWKCLIGGASKWKHGQVLTKTIQAGAQRVTLEARYLEKQEDAFLIELSWDPATLTFAELLHEAGLVPLPPYIKRDAQLTDSERYQTIYARHDGSVAAPTAGLHFTDSIFKDLANRNIQHNFVTLHVGAGTFLPVKAQRMEHHVMHIEWIVVTVELIQALREHLLGKKAIIAVGTTSARTLESLYWLGAKTITKPDISPDNLVVGQWEAYEQASAIQPEAALTALLDWMQLQQLSELATTTQLLITPGYTWRIVKGLVTNFHQPESTLLLLIASLVGEDWRRIYQHALQKGFRFLSYGDGCLLFPHSPAVTSS